MPASLIILSLTLAGSLLLLVLPVIPNSEKLWGVLCSVLLFLGNLGLCAIAVKEHPRAVRNVLLALAAIAALALFTLLK